MRRLRHPIRNGLIALRDDPRYMALPYLAIAILIGVGVLMAANRARHADQRAAALDRQQTAAFQWSQYDQSTLACERANGLRQQIRARDSAYQEIAIAFSVFLRQSVEFRRASDQDTLAMQAARLKAAVDGALARQRPIRDVNCSAVIHPPTVPRPRPNGGIG